MTTTKARSWQTIEHAEYDSENYLLVAYRNHMAGYRQYLVWGMIAGQPISEHYTADNDDNKRLAYDWYYEQMERMVS